MRRVGEEWYRDEERSKHNGHGRNGQNAALHFHCRDFERVAIYNIHTFCARDGSPCHLTQEEDSRKRRRLEDALQRGFLKMGNLKCMLDLPLLLLLLFPLSCQIRLPKMIPPALYFYPARETSVPCPKTLPSNLLPQNTSLFLAAKHNPTTTPILSIIPFSRSVDNIIASALLIFLLPLSAILRRRQRIAWETFAERMEEEGGGCNFLIVS